MFKAFFYPREVIFYTDNVQPSMTNSMTTTNISTTNTTKQKNIRKNSFPYADFKNINRASPSKC